MNKGKAPRVFPKVKRVAEEKGVLYVVLAGVRKTRNRLTTSFWYNYFRLFKSWRKLSFQQKEYKYFYHKYNTTWRNERAVEIPIVWDIVKSCKENILEVGNVLSHYFAVNHVIIDKYEKSENVITEDVTEICLSKKYDLIVSISTLEHVEWDENQSDHKILYEHEKIIHAIAKLKENLSPKGKIVVTLPLGYNHELDALLKNRKIRFDRLFLPKAHL